MRGESWPLPIFETPPQDTGPWVPLGREEESKAIFLSQWGLVPCSSVYPLAKFMGIY